MKPPCRNVTSFQIESIYFHKASLKICFSRFFMPIFTKIHASTKLRGILQSSKHKICIPQRDLLSDTKSASIQLFDQKLSQKYNNIHFFSLIIAYLPLPFSYLGYILGLVIPYVRHIYVWNIWIPEQIEEFNGIRPNIWK